MTHRQASSICSSPLHKALAEATELGFEVSVTTQDQRIIPNGHLERDPRDPSRLEILIPSKYAIDTEATIDCLFTTMEKPYFFRSKVEEQTGTGKNYRRYRIAVPETIEQCNRRLYQRVHPATDQPVWLHYDHEQKGTVRVMIEDICTGGVCIVMPETLRIDDIPNPLPCKIGLSDDATLHVSISPCNKRKLFGIVKIGAEIVSMDEEDRGKIEAYVNHRMNEIESMDEKNGQKDIRMAVIEHPSQKTLTPLLTDRYTINRAWQANNIAKLRAYLPDIIVVDMDHPEAITCLQSIKDSPALRVRPLVIVGQMNRTIMAFGSGIRYLSKPVHRHYLQQAVDQLISEYRISLRIFGLPTRCWQTTTVAIIRLSEEKNNEATVQHLRHNNIQAIVIENQNRLLPQLLQKDPQCIILDADDADSIDTICRILSLSKQLKHTPIILLTKQRELGEQFTNKNLVTGFIEKSSSPEVLTSAVYCAIKEKN